MLFPDFQSVICSDFSLFNEAMKSKGPDVSLGLLKLNLVRERKRGRTERYRALFK